MGKKKISAVHFKMEVELQKCLRNSQKFSQIFQFINNFGPFVQISWTFEQLENMLVADVDSRQSDELVKAMMGLIRKIAPTYRPLSGLAGLDKFIATYSGIENPDNSEDYQSLDLQGRMDLLLEILYLSCRTHFGIVAGFKQRQIPYHELRWKPVGKDYDGLEYYYQEDCEFNPRIYIANSDGDGESWTLKTKTRQGIYKLIKNLQGEEVSEESQNLIPEITMSAADKKKYRLSDHHFSYGNFYKQIEVKVKKSKMKFAPKKVNSENKENAPEKKEEKKEQEAPRKILKPVKKGTTTGLEKEANLMSSWLKQTPKEAKYACKKCHENGSAKQMNACKVCDKYYHIECVNTKTKQKLWTCPICTNKELVGRLSMIYIRLAEVIQQKIEQVYNERKIQVKSKYSLRKYEDLDKLEEELWGEGSDVSEDDEEEDYKEDEDEIEEESEDEEEEEEEEEEEDDD
ncbi:unnamed protein product [Bursaphelenchus xylophilus]|uniref:(pine wood nematode) hypothetical protein n=1 Tax=Bursaphelenchus xylophilus TaxID=6326 RepID=A0A1I7RV37_BURXY|nr:unnamed protein product [Bursaphelenchus xylophilus]CAG9105145.1 unnamed protein product [Bursaphelenchus xylophilus]